MRYICTAKAIRVRKPPSDFLGGLHQRRFWASRCLLASGGAHDELAFKVSRELHSHGELVLDEISAQLCFHSFLRRADSAVQRRPPRDRQNRHGESIAVARGARYNPKIKLVAPLARYFMET